MPQIHKQENTAVNDYKGGIAIICANPSDKSRLKQRAPRKSGRSEKAKNTPAGCRDYPPGYTVFECRLDGNRPIAQVVQVPSDTVGDSQNGTCVLLETRQSESGPSSRVVAYPAVRKSYNTRPATEPMSFALESQDCPGGAVARAEKVAEHVAKNSEMCSKPITILETTKGPTCRGPSSRLLYGSVSPRKSSGCYERPGFHIQCSTTTEGSVARVTQVPRGPSSGDPGTSYEASVKRDGSEPTAVVTKCNDVEVGQEFLETRVDASGPRAKALALPEGSSDFRHFTNLDVRPQENGPFARISQFPGKPQEFIKDLGTRQVDRQSCHCNWPVNQCGPTWSPSKSFGTSGIKQSGAKPVSDVGRRNGLSWDQEGPSGTSKSVAMKKGKFGEVRKTCPANCCRPFSSPHPKSTVCRGQRAPCARKMMSVVTGTETCPKPATCFCPKQQCKIPDHPFSAFRPLPGGSVVPQCPPPSLPEIAPVPTGVNRLRDSEPRTKKKKPRNPTKATPLRSKKPPRVEVVFKKPVIAPPTVKKTKNKKTGRSGKHRKPPKKMDDVVGDEELTLIPQETYVECPGSAPKRIESLDACETPTCIECPAFASKEIELVGDREKPSEVECPAFASKEVQAFPPCEKKPAVECPAFASKGVQSHSICENGPSIECPAFASRGIQSDRFCQDPPYAKCSAVASKGNQSIRDRDEPSYMGRPLFATKRHQSVQVCKVPSYVECPAFASNGNQGNRVRDDPSRVECPAFVSRRHQSNLVADDDRYVRHTARNKLVSRFEEPEYVKCTGFARKKSSETCSVNVPRDEVFVSKYSEHFRPIDCCAKRNRLQDECRPYVPQSVLRMSYEQRRNRHARTLLSSGTRHRRFDDDVNAIRTTYCVRG